MEGMEFDEYEQPPSRVIESDDVSHINIPRRDYASESMAADMDRWIVYHPSSADISVEEWIENNRPSVISREDGVGWISVVSPQDSQTDTDPIGLQESWEQLKQSGRTLDISSITAIAKMHNVTAGKWMLFAHDTSGAKIDYLWTIVARATAGAQLGICAKVSPFDPSGKGDYVVCVYNKDFTNTEEVYNLESAIRSAGIKCQLYYKPDCYTYLGIYRKNDWGIRPTLYESAFDITQGTSVIQAH